MIVQSVSYSCVRCSKLKQECVFSLFFAVYLPPQNYCLLSVTHIVSQPPLQLSLKLGASIAYIRALLKTQ